MNISFTEDLEPSETMSYVWNNPIIIFIPSKDIFAIFEISSTIYSIMLEFINSINARLMGISFVWVIIYFNIIFFIGTLTFRTPYREKYNNFKRIWIIICLERATDSIQNSSGEAKSPCKGGQLGITRLIKWTQTMWIQLGWA